MTLSYKCENYKFTLFNNSEILFISTVLIRFKANVRNCHYFYDNMDHMVPFYPDNYLKEENLEEYSNKYKQHLKYKKR